MKSNRSARYILLIIATTLFTTSGMLLEAFAYKSITDRSNSVRVDVRPLQLQPGQPVRFEVRMNTHSVTLSQDLQAVSILEDNGGKTYQPTGWKGSPPGGHHRRGTLEFPPLEGSPESITLVIRDTAEGPERVFEWSLK